MICKQYPHNLLAIAASEFPMKQNLNAITAPHNP
jgi:hypothetical protein